MRLTLSALCLSAMAAMPAFAADCITSKGNWSAYKSHFAGDAKSSGVGQRGLQALNGASLSGITWRFESSPSSQKGTLQADPARFLAKRSGSSADDQTGAQQGCQEPEHL